MDRLTTNKEVSDMSMYELTHNSCYVKDGNARYRDYETDMDARHLTIQLLKKFTDDDAEFIDDEDFDEWMCDYLQYGFDTLEGLIAVFYRNIWGMAGLREILKTYEDAEEQGLLLELPCKVGDTVYALSFSRDEVRWFECIVETINICSKENYAVVYCKELDLGATLFFDSFGKTVFLTKEEAEQALQRMKEGV